MMIKNYKSYINVKESERNARIRKITNKLLYISFLVVLFFLSCSEENSENSKQIEQIMDPLTEEKCVNFAEQLHYSFADSNAKYMNSYMDWHSIESFVTNHDQLRREIFDTLISRYNITESFIHLSYSQADVRFITYYQEGEKHYLIFRTFEQPQNLNVYEFELSGNAGEIMISDIYDYYGGKSIRTSLSIEIDFWSKWGGEWYSYYQKFRELEVEYSKFMMTGDLKSAYLQTKLYVDDFGELDRFTQLYGVICENSGSQELMIGYLAEMVNNIPLNEKGRWLPLFYLRTLEGNYGEALITLSNLEKEIGQDVYLDFLKGNVYFEMGEYEAAVNWFNAALSQTANVEMFHLGKVHSYINLKRYVEAVETLLVMDDSFDIDDINWKLEFEEYSDFVKSEEFEEFLSRLDTSIIE